MLYGVWSFKINIMAGINFINEEEYSKPLTFKNNDVINVVVSSFLCEGCGSVNIKERSGYKVCFDCGKGH